MSFRTNELLMTRTRSYQTSHPWIVFQINLRAASPTLWITLGECHSKCEHLAGVPLAPDIDSYLHRVYLAKGVAATTAIEGNTLSEKQVLDHIEGKLELKPSEEYLKQEINNIIKACNMMVDEIKTDKLPPLSVERIKLLNKMVLDQLKLEEGVISGEIRKHAVGVLRYRGAPSEDCEYLLRRLCEWLNGPDFAPGSGQEVMYAIIKAIIAHLYLAWIHPFGDGNGRTARLVEIQILLSSGVPSPAAQLLSNHYNATRAAYYQALDSARQEVLNFVSYAVNGLRDGLREQIESIRYEQWEIAWVNHVHRSFDGSKGSTATRRKHLVLDLSKDGEVEFSKLRELSPRTAVAYNDKTSRTLMRDLAALEKMQLIARTAKGKWIANKNRILAFLPVRAQIQAHNANRKAKSRRAAAQRDRESSRPIQREKTA